MDLTGRFGIIPLFSMIILAIGLMNHVLVIPPLFDAAVRDAWLSVLAITIPYLLWCTIIYTIMKRTNQQPLLLWLNQHYHPAVAMIVRIFFIVYLYVICSITVVETTFWTKITYLNRTPLFMLSFGLMLFCFFAARWGMRSIAIASGILLPFVIVFGDFVMSANLPKKNYSLLFPIMENGIGPMLHGMVYIGGGLVELIVILLLQHYFKSRIKFWWLAILAFFLVILVFGPVTGAIAEFGPFEATDLRFPAYEEWRLVSIGKYIQHVDFLSIYQWLSGAVIRISAAMLIITELLPVKQQKARSRYLLFIGIPLVFIPTLPFGDMKYMAFMKNIYFPFALISVLLMSFVILLLCLFRKPNKTTAKGMNK